MRKIITDKQRLKLFKNFNKQVSILVKEKIDLLKCKEKIFFKLFNIILNKIHCEHKEIYSHVFKMQAEYLNKNNGLLQAWYKKI